MFYGRYNLEQDRFEIKEGKAGDIKASKGLGKFKVAQQWKKDKSNRWHPLD